MDDIRQSEGISEVRVRRDGFTLLEILVTLAVMGIIMGMLIPTIMAAREVVRSDQLQTTVNQNVRGGADLIGSDIRIAGERFPSETSLQLLPIEIVPGGDGGPDEVILRRNLWGGSLSICEPNFQGSQQAVRVVRNTGWLNSPTGQQHPECGQPTNDEGWPVNLWDVRALADTLGTDGELRGYVFDPAAGVGEFISFEVRDNADNTGQIHRTETDNLSHNYQLANRPWISIMSERRYRVRDNAMELVIDGNEDDALRTSADITDLQAQFVFNDGSLSETMPTDKLWRDIAALEITISGITRLGPEEVEQTLTSRYFPRNVLSR